MAAEFISSRTPEGTPNHCPVCGADVCLEPSLFCGDAPCPRCGCLLWFLNLPERGVVLERDKSGDKKRRVTEVIAEQLGVDPDKVDTANLSFVNDLGADSLDMVELVMELEEELEQPPA